MEDFNIDDIFADVVSATNLDAGKHENVRLVSVSIEPRKDKNGKNIKKQAYMVMKKYDGKEIIGEKDISFFLLDATKDSYIDNAISYISQLKEILSIYYNEEELTASFDPLRDFLSSPDDVDEKTLTADTIKANHLKGSTKAKALEKAINASFYAMVKDKIGASSKEFNLTLEESRDGKYIQLPRFNKFINAED